MSLIDPVPVDRLPDPEALGPLHFIAIGGSGMNGVATVYAQRGIAVSGSDRQDSDYLRSLAAAGVRTHVGHAAEQLGDARAVVASSAIREDNPELAEARRRGLPVLHRSVALAALVRGKRGIAVAGTHGKTTTTGMIAEVLTRLDADPSYVIGGALYHPGRVGGSKTGGHHGAGPDFVVEADESDGSFLQYPVEVAVVTNVDPDHLVNWGTGENYREGFARFASAPGLRLLVVSADEPGAVELTGRLRERGTAARIVTFGRAADADVRITDESYRGTGSAFRLTDATGALGVPGTGGEVRLAVPGDYNVSNAAAAYAVARWLDHPDAEVRDALSHFPGTYRRFQLVGTAAGVRVFDDYAHHPTEVANTVRAARTGLDGGRLIAVMQPHLYTRTRDFFAEFGQALVPADEAVVMDVCGDREDPIPGITGALVADAVPPGTAHVTYEPTWAATPATVAGLARPGDLVVTLGCGDVTKIAPLIVEQLAAAETALAAATTDPETAGPSGAGPSGAGPSGDPSRADRGESR
ncbi:UDP-N-acetylmuramate--alanine ligase [Friedmanniella endophytica]|uniref:UDP-N-acetylmuramate--L-alanine ligase n=1 Tax=Microlunatus kandeliicorticis TaxID=1759536 RepID=A0A7W3P5U4_9ACTN|nr:UDP-N-acetylmuramate--alanine ligase [Microlunatus kandeliicorticis]